ncbi:MAG: LysR family transcriptional regulator [Thermodesulfobacteriota bacterium]
MNVNHLKAFYAVAKAKGFTHAARQLNVSQPTLSMQVKSLEKRFSVPLIKRNKKTFELTEEGKLVFTHAEKIFLLIHDLTKELENFESHNMVIGSTSYISNHVLPEILQAIQEKFSDVKVQIYTGLSKEILNKVVDYEHHLAVIARVPYPDNVVSIPVLKAQLVFISKDDMGGQVSLKDLVNSPIILPERGSATRDYLLHAFQSRDWTITHSIECENPPAIRHMVQLGMGGAFFPLFSVQRDVQEGRFHMAVVKEDLSLDYDLVFLQDRRSSPPVRIFISAMKKLQRSHSRSG